nr:hypothetical protein [Tanacetum cinerariifolium]
MHDSDESADYESMHEDDLRSVSRFENVDFDDTQENDVSHSNHTFPDHNAFAEQLFKALKCDMGKSMTTLVKSVIIDDTVEGEKNKKAKDTNPAPTQGEPQSTKTLVKSQWEQPTDLNGVNKQSAPPASNAKLNEGKKLVVHNSEEKKLERIISMEDD